MAEQLSSDNTKRILLEGNGVKAASQPRPIRQQRKAVADVIVENTAEKRYLWTARAFAVVFAVSCCCNLILTYVIMTAIPLYRVEPYLFSFADKGEQIYHIEQVQKIYDYKYLTEIFVREYVLLRNTWINDEEEMRMRWDPGSNLQEMSSDRVYAYFKEKQKEEVIKAIRQNNLTQNVKIISATEVGPQKQGMGWQVEFRTEEMSPTRETPIVKVWVANLTIQYRSKRVKFGERLKNPLGFTVFDYKTTERKG